MSKGSGWPLVAPQLGLTWLEETEETSVLWAELEMSESSVMGFPQTVSMMQARNYGDGNVGSAPGTSRVSRPPPLVPNPCPQPPRDSLPIPHATFTPSPGPSGTWDIPALEMALVVLGCPQVSPGISVPGCPPPCPSYPVVPHLQVAPVPTPWTSLDDFVSKCPQVSLVPRWP